MYRGNDPNFNPKRCPSLTMAGSLCKLSKLPGYKTCHMHLSPLERKRWDLQRKGEIKIRCRHVNKEGVQCRQQAMYGFNVCYQHATPHERKAKRRKRKRAETKQKFNSYKSPAKRHKNYNGMLKENVYKVEDGEVYGFYEGAFVSAQQRALFKHAPVAAIDDDIKVVRYLIRDALQNQMAYEHAILLGDVSPKGFVVFSREVNETIDENGNIIAQQKREIRRKRDYLSDIRSLEGLLHKMLQVRIELQQAGTSEENAITPFNFNILPPSNPDLLPNNIKELPDAPLGNPEDVEDVIDVEVVKGVK